MSTVHSRGAICHRESGNEDDVGELYVLNNPGTIILDHNLYYRANDAQTMMNYNAAEFTQAQFAAYQAATGQDANSLSAIPFKQMSGQLSSTRVTSGKSSSFERVQ